MQVFASFRWVLPVALLAYVATPAEAQPTQPASPSAAGANATVGFQRKTVLSPQEQLVESSKHLARMELAAGGVRKMLESARAQRDVVKTLCLNDKLSQVDVAIRSGRDRRTQLAAAVTRADTEAASHQFTILTVLRQRTEQLVAEANQCIGEESAFVGDTRTKVSIDPTIPQDETPYPVDTTIILGPPQCASCTL
jgi:hypothetical protein